VSGPATPGRVILGPVAHLIHAAEPLAAVREWYATLFDPVFFGDDDPEHFPTFELELRDAAVAALADTVIEIMSPARHLHGWKDAPIAKFLARRGPGWYSLAWYVDDIAEVHASLVANGCRVVGFGGARLESVDETTQALFTHPRDSYGALQFSNRDLLARTAAADPRSEPEWSDDRWRGRPLGLIGVASMSVVTDDLPGATAFYERALGGRPSECRASALIEADVVSVDLGAGGIIDLERPWSSMSVGGKDLAAFGSMTHAVTFRVEDLGRATQFLTSHGVLIEAVSDELVVCGRQSTFGAVLRFTTAPAAPPTGPTR
jgi:catechol 2,3-dioxygenase-like lactoylglutathione lyase family enzyme